MLISSDPTPHGLRAWKECEPWLVYTAINWLDEYLTKDMQVFEWGCGGSTIWYSRRVARVVSVEHDLHWLEKVQQSIHEKGITNSRIHYIAKTEGAGGFAAYADIARHTQKQFDLVVVDGRGRVHCMASGMTIVKPGGYLLLDNAERPYYQEGIDYLCDWTRTDYRDRWLTSLFQRPVN